MTPDFTIFSDVPHPTVYLFTPVSTAARQWASAHLPTDVPKVGESFVVESRFISDIVQAVIREGMQVSG